MSIWGVSLHHHGGFAAAHGFDPTKNGARAPASFADMMTNVSGSGTGANAGGPSPAANDLTDMAGLFGFFGFQAPDAGQQPSSAADDPQQNSGTGLNDMFTTVSVTVQDSSAQPIGQLHAMMNAMMTEMHRLMEMAEHLLADVEPHCCHEGGSATAADAPPPSTTPGSADGTTSPGTTTGSSAADPGAPAATAGDAASTTPPGSTADAPSTGTTAPADNGSGSGSSVAEASSSSAPLDVADVVPAIAPLDPGIDPTTGLPKAAA